MNYYNYALIFGCFVLIILLITNLELVQLGGASMPLVAPEESLPNLSKRCDYNTTARPCFHGSIFFQNCKGEFLTATKPYNKLVWSKIPNSKSCFLLRKPLFDIQPMPDPETDQKYFCSIESNGYPNYFLRSNQQGEMHLESAENMAIKHMERNDFIFQLERGLNMQFHTVTIRPVNPVYGNACFFDDGEGIRFTPKKCLKTDEFKDKASFYIGINIYDYDWWWRHLSLFKYDRGNSLYQGKVLGDSMSQSLNTSLITN